MMCWAVSKSDTKARPQFGRAERNRAIPRFSQRLCRASDSFVSDLDTDALAAPGQPSGTLVDSDRDGFPFGATYVETADSALGTCPLAQGRRQEWRRAS